MRSDKQQAAAARKFAEKWQDRGYEKGESQKFWMELLADVYGVQDVTDFIEFEDQVMLDSTSFIDGYIPTTRVMIEQKSLGKDLRKPIRQSDGSMLTPFQQAKRYVSGLPLSRHPRWVVVSNFAEFLVYDMERPNSDPESILLENMAKEWHRLRFLVDTRSEHIERELEVSMKAGEIIGEVYDALLDQYGDTDDETLRQLNILCVRLVFCLYAEDAGIFGRDQFHDYLAKQPVELMRESLLQLFKVLNTPDDQRSRYMRDELRAFPYTNGGLFAEEIDIPQFTPELAQLLLQNASLDFDWSEISPTIFGAVFESTLNPVTRRTGGMHYTSIENIHKVIDPLFLNDLRREFDEICRDKSPRSQRAKLLAFQDKLASLTFLDPACGSGNFLTETYLSLRRLENEVVMRLTGGRSVIGFEDITPIKVSINQFHGIEINDFAVTVAITALWISEAQMLRETERIIQHDIDFLPLKSYANIREGNALRMEWDIVNVPDDTVTIHAQNTYLTLEEQPQSVVSEPVLSYGSVNLTTSQIHPGPKPAPEPTRVRYDYIIGNPPFVGYFLQSKEQKKDLLQVFVDAKGRPFKTAGKIDYVAGWYYKAAKLMQGTNTRAALVSTNSITQGEQVAAIWKPLQAMFGLQIDFAYRTFRWDSESSQKAHVHCVVIGFSCGSMTAKPRTIFDGDKCITASHINAYLMEADDIFIERRFVPISDVPEMWNGGKPTEGGYLILNEEEKQSLLNTNPESLKFIRPYMMGKDFINRKPRYCLWLVSAAPNEIRKIAKIRARVANVKAYRLNSPKNATKRKADTPMLFDEVRECVTDYIAIPKVSSESRRYIPIDYLSKNIIPGDKLFCLQGATLYHFGILTSNVHMAWTRAVCGRLKSDYSYSNTIVYNNFPWPEVADAQRARIEATAQGILDARALYPDSSLADLYDEVTMPPELSKAHLANDRAVMEAYGMDWHTMTESQCVGELFKRYQHLMR